MRLGWAQTKQTLSFNRQALSELSQAGSSIVEPSLTICPTSLLGAFWFSILVGFRTMNRLRLNYQKLGEIFSKLRLGLKTKYWSKFRKKIPQTFWALLPCEFEPWLDPPLVGIFAFFSFILLLLPHSFQMFNQQKSVERQNQFFCRGKKVDIMALTLSDLQLLPLLWGSWRSKHNYSKTNANKNFESSQTRPKKGRVELL